MNPEYFLPMIVEFIKGLKSANIILEKDRWRHISLSIQGISLDNGRIGGGVGLGYKNAQLSDFTFLSVLGFNMDGLEKWFDNEERFFNARLSEKSISSLSVVSLETPLHENPPGLASDEKPSSWVLGTGSGIHRISRERDDDFVSVSLGYGPEFKVSFDIIERYIDEKIIDRCGGSSEEFEKRDDFFKTEFPDADEKILCSLKYCLMGSIAKFYKDVVKGIME